MDLTEIIFIHLTLVCLFSGIDLATVSRIKTLTAARCHAACISQFSNSQSKNDQQCGEDQCRQCVSWCRSSLDKCNKTCSNKVCTVACDVLKNIPSDIDAGFGFPINKSGIPYVENKNFSSLTLRWTPARSLNNDTVVYSLEMQYGKKSSAVNKSVNLNLITHVPYATLTPNDLCKRTDNDFRSDPVHYYFKFRIVALTEKSKTATSKYSQAIGLPRPPQVENLKVAIGPFEKDRAGDKLLVSLNWNLQQRTSDFVKFYIKVTCSVDEQNEGSNTCGRRATLFLPRDYTSDKSKTSTKFYLSHRSVEKSNILHFTVVAMIGCGVSKETMVNVTYPGCRVINGFPTQTCCETEAPNLPEVDRRVRNLVYRSLQTEPDYRFKTTLTWRPPAYMEKTNCTLLKSYFLTYGDPSKLRLFFGKRIWGNIKSNYKETYFGPVFLEPGTAYALEIIPLFGGGVKGVKKNITFYAPGVPLDKVKIQDFSVRGIKLSYDGFYNVTASWKKPTFNYSSIEYFLFVYYYEDGRNVSKKLNSNSTNYTITGGMHGETLEFEITPWYLHSWVPKFKSRRVSLQLPKPARERMTVRNLSYEFSNYSQSTINVTFTWDKPAFKYSDVLYYNVFVIFGATPYRRNMTRQWLTITMGKQSKEISISVTPVFDNPYLKSVTEHLTATVPDKEVDTDANKKPRTANLSTQTIIIICVVLFVLLLFLVLLVILVPKWRETKKLKDEGFITGKNGFVFDEWEIDPVNLVFEHEIGEGAFGKVYSGILQKLPEPATKAAFFSGLAARKAVKTNDDVTVAVKLLHSHLEQSEERNSFLEEIQLMKSVGFHSNIVNMLGCSTIKQPMCLIVEYVPYGDLLHYLRKRRGDVKEYLNDDHSGPYRSSYFDNFKLLESYAKMDNQLTREDRIYVNRPGAGSLNRDESSKSDTVQVLSYRENLDGEKTEFEEIELKNVEEKENDLSPGDLLAFAWQVSRGMEYLAKRGFIHRDIAARNILIGHNKVAKIADFGLTRCVYDEGGIYPVKTKRKLPLKWMSIEAIFDGVFTTQSDVWSFGILLWEIGTLGGTPYPTVNNHDLLKFLKSGQRMEKPEMCNDEYYAIMAKCWKGNPDERPSFAQLREDLENMMIVDKPYLDFDGLDESRDYYNVPSFHSIEEDEEEVLSTGEADDISSLPKLDDDKASEAFLEDSKHKWNEEKDASTEGKQMHQEENVEHVTPDTKIPYQRQDSEESNRPLIKKNSNMNIDEIQSLMCRPLAQAKSFGS